MGIRIPVVENEERIVDFLVHELREEGFTAEHAADVDLARRALRSGLSVRRPTRPGAEGVARKRGGRGSMTTRLTASFLALLAVVLFGFSPTLRLLAREYLHHQMDERPEATLQTLIAAIEFDPAGLEWEPNQQLAAGSRASPGASPGAEVEIESEPRPRHPSLILTAGQSLLPVKVTLLHLARLLAGPSLGLWLAAAALGRRLCRRALVPVTRRAEAARAMGAADLDQRLPAPETGDELQELGGASNGSLVRLHEAFERQRQFTGDASHQLRTPRAALLGQVGVTLRRERSVDK